MTSFSDNLMSVDSLLQQASENLKISPNKAEEALTQLESLAKSFDSKQKDRYHILRASFLGFRGRHKERVLLAESYIAQVTDPEVKVRFLYQLSDGYTNLGQYEQALDAMNKSILLLPKLVKLNAKIDTLQTAITLLNSLHAYDESMVYADRMYSLEAEENNFFPKCIALADRIDINFLRGKRDEALSLVKEAEDLCGANDRKIIVLIVKALVVLDSIKASQYSKDLDVAIALLSEFKKINDSSDYLIHLNDAVAKIYLKSENFSQAERYGAIAFETAKKQNVVQLLERSAETMAAIKRAQGQFSSALEYYDTSLALKDKILDDQLHKNLAYQRVKYDSQDKANQLSLLEQKNKTLAIARQLEKRNNQNLILLVTLISVTLLILTAWLIRTWQQKNQFRQTAQIDGLTQISNRAHFIASGTHTMQSTHNAVSVILFDMDFFKRINDSFGHAVGDWVLRTVAEKIKALLGKKDLFGRLGGEEFVICIPGASEEETVALADRCRVAIMEIDTNPSGYRFPISASFGVATRAAHADTSFEDMLAAADKALYVSKTDGRNRVSTFQ
ncbi:diguanylate cyclase [Undibacterium sp. Rencai35W]|uniref:GGDEF domain-containing protein n=1 Tax=Undibacterium sp. Rencai35W TaxID=3413046 RepID=UPI003BF00BDA